MIKALSKNWHWVLLGAAIMFAVMWYIGARSHD
jgi:hypothetical protein